ncbi:Ku70-binding family protein [Striga hermonthica]|uniref:Mitochondrial inner membrane protease ATP23 n=1 Tax=Striga hermonthica TaxID=68872 RepID=A0A9N7NR77_STRHE|nr:Ku70-binding family protein [Striga hermonthica]
MADEPDSKPSPGMTVEECQNMIQRSLRTPMVKFLKEHLEKSGCGIGSNFIKAVNCKGATAGGYVKGEGIVVCSNHLQIQDEVTQVVIHELIHAYDECRSANLDWSDCAHHACSEIRVGHLSGDCHYKRELLRPKSWSKSMPTLNQIKGNGPTPRKPKSVKKFLISRSASPPITQIAILSNSRNLSLHLDQSSVKFKKLSSFVSRLGLAAVPPISAAVTGEICSSAPVNAKIRPAKTHLRPGLAPSSFAATIDVKTSRFLPPIALSGRGKTFIGPTRPAAKEVAAVDSGATPLLWPPSCVPLTFNSPTEITVKGSIRPSACNSSPEFVVEGRAIG